MAKKKKDQAVVEAEQHEIERRQAIAEYNVNNMGKYWIDPDKTPTDDDIAQAKKDFDDFTEEMNKNNAYVIADAPNAKRVAQFLRDFVQNCFWTQSSWIGVLNFDAMLADFLKDFDDEKPVDLVMEYAPMQFAYLILENYAGTGIDAARHMAEINDEWVAIHDHIYELVQEFNKKVQHSNDLKDRWAMLSQGYYMTIMKADGEDAEAAEDEAKAETEAESSDETAVYEGEPEDGEEGPKEIPAPEGLF
jgi:hypothetical protein